MPSSTGYCNQELLFESRRGRGILHSYARRQKPPSTYCRISFREIIGREQALCAFINTSVRIDEQAQRRNIFLCKSHSLARFWQEWSNSTYCTGTLPSDDISAYLGGGTPSGSVGITASAGTPTIAVGTSADGTSQAIPETSSMDDLLQRSVPVQQLTGRQYPFGRTGSLNIRARRSCGTTSIFLVFFLGGFPPLRVIKVMQWEKDFDIR